MPTDIRSTKPFLNLHYAWIVMLSGFAVVFACIGLGRYSLGMLLPAMGKALGLSYSQMGLISTGNLVGYFSGVSIAGAAANRFGARRTVVAGLFMVAVSMMMMSRMDDFYLLMCLYTATGIGTAVSNVPMMGLIAHWFLKEIRGRATGMMLTGNALAIVFAGIYIPRLSTADTVSGWRAGWFNMGIVCAFIMVAAAVLIRNTPGEKNLLPLGTAENSPDRKVMSGPPVTHIFRSKTLILLGSILALFGATQMIYSTFIVTVLVETRGFDQTIAGTFWAGVGGISIFSGQVFGWASDRLGRRAAIMIVNTLFTLSFLLAALDLPLFGLLISIALFGLCMWSIPTIVYAAVGDYLGPDRAVAGIGMVTLICGAGQIIGPAAAGIIADFGGGFSATFALCALFSTVSVVIAYFIKPPGRQDA